MSKNKYKPFYIELYRNLVAYLPSKKIDLKGTVSILTRNTVIIKKYIKILEIFIIFKSKKYHFNCININ